MRVFVFIFIFSLFGVSKGQTIQEFKSELTKFSALHELKNASVGFYAVDLKTNEIIGELNPNLSLIPASITKVITTACGIEILGTDYRFKTEIYYTGEIDKEKKILNGNIIIRGFGDPCLGSHRFSSNYGDFINKWTLAIKQMGIDSVCGDIISDASYFSQQSIPPTWIWGDIGNYYGAVASGLSVYENLFTAQFTSGKLEGDSTKIVAIKPFTPGLEVENYVKSANTNKDESFFYGGPYQNNKYAKGKIPVNKTNYEVKGSIPDPALLLSFELSEELKKNGVGVSGKYTTTRIECTEINYLISKNIATTQSPVLSEIIKQINHHSINLYAEHILNEIGVKQKDFGDTDTGAVAIVDFLKNKGIDVSGFYLSDGSGLSRFNSITATHFVEVLKMMRKSKNYEVYNASFPVAGISGTVRSFGAKTALEGNARIKSGYMVRVRSYAGYIKTKSNREVGFAVMVNNYNCSPQMMKLVLEKLVTKIAEINQ